MRALADGHLGREKKSTFLMGREHDMRQIAFEKMAPPSEIRPRRSGHGDQANILPLASGEKVRAQNREVTLMFSWGSSPQEALLPSLGSELLSM